MELTLSITTLLLALHTQYAHGENTTAPTSEPTLEPTVYFTSTIGDIATTVDECDSFLPLIPGSTDDPTDDDTDCLYSTEVSLGSSEHIVATICGYKNDTSGRQYVSVTLSLPADIWFGIGFVSTANFNAAQRMAGYAIIAPSCVHELQERFITGQGATGLGEVMASSITVFEDTIEDMVRTIRFKRPVTVALGDIGADALGENLLAIDDGHYFDFSEFQECDASIKVIYAFGSTNWDASGNNYHHSNRGDATASILEVASELCEDEGSDSGANAFSVMATMVISVFVGVMLW